MIPGWHLGDRAAWDTNIQSVPSEKHVAFVSPDSTFEFECKPGGEAYCCAHADTCEHPGEHRVSTIEWEHRDGQFRCPKLTEDNRCSIHAVRPITCRIYPLGATILYNERTVLCWSPKTLGENCKQCFSGRRWTIPGWLNYVGFWAMIEENLRLAKLGRQVPQP